MGMFDYIKCDHPLPKPDGCIVDPAKLEYQTKDTPAQLMDNYWIKEDGTLWHKDYDVEDHSDPTKEGIERLFGMLTHVNERWVQLKKYTGEIRFCDIITLSDGKPQEGGWIEYSAYFSKGKLKELNLIEYTEPKPL